MAENDLMDDGTGVVPIAVPVIYVSDFGYSVFNPADLFDIAFLLRSEKHDLRCLCLTESEGDGERIVRMIALHTDRSLPCYPGASGLIQALQDAPVSVNLVVAGGYSAVASVLATHRPLIREKVLRLFLTGGQINDYSTSRTGERIPIDPRLKERHPEYYSPAGDPRISDIMAFGQILTSGEGIIWLPRDICLWRYAAPQLLSDGGVLTEFLLRELFFYHLTMGGITDRYDAAEAPALLSSLPGLLLATEPDPFAWMRLFRVVPARVEITDGGAVSMVKTSFHQSDDTGSESPNLYTVIAIDGTALGKVLTKALRVRPLTV